MNQKIKFSIALSLLLGLVPASSTALAASNEGGHVGNGGNAVICQDSAGKTSAHLFDYWEMDRASPIAGGIQLGEASLSVRDKIEIALRRIERIEAPRARKYRAQANDILDHLGEFLTDVLPPIEDDDNDRVPMDPACRKVQFAVQISKPEPGKRRFQIDAKLYGAPEMTQDARAGLILHEVIYREALGLGQKNSDRVRSFNYAIATQALDVEMDYPVYLDLLKETGFTPAPELCRSVETSMGRILYVTMSAHELQPKPHEGYPICRGARWSSEGLTVDLEPQASGAYFFGNHVARLWTKGFSYRSTDGQAFTGDVNLDLHPSGRVAGLWTGHAIIEVEGKRLNCNNGYVEFSEKGRVRGCYLPKLKFTLANGQSLSTTLVKVDDDGHIIWAYLHDSLLNVPGSSVRFAFRTVTLNARKELVAGSFATPIPYLFQGYSLGIYELRFDSGKIIANASGNIPVRHQGKRLILDPSSPLESVEGKLRFQLKGYCASLGFSTASPEAPWVSVKASTAHVGAYEEFYEPVQGLIVGKMDEDIQLLEAKKACGLEFEYKP